MTRRPVLTEREPRRHAPFGLALSLLTVGLLGWALATLPGGDSPLPAIARYALTIALPRWHTTEPVNEIVYGTRAFDTVGETFLLIAAVIGIGVIARRREHRRGFIGEEVAGARERRSIDPQHLRSTDDERLARRAETREEGEDPSAESTGRTPAARSAGATRAAGVLDDPDHEPLGTPGPEQAAAMTVPVRGTVRVVASVLTVAGCYLAAWGYAPGGGFPAGAILLGVALLAYVSLGYRRVEPLLRPDVMEPVELAGAVGILLVGLLGLALRGSFTANFLPLGPPATIRSGGVLQLVSGGELIEVATGLILAVFGLLGMAHDWSDEQS